MGKGREVLGMKGEICLCRSIDLMKNIISPRGEENRVNSEIAGPPPGEDW
jgi:hypothetical protein